MALLDLDAILSQKMDAVETLPDYVTPPTGTYTLSINNAEVTLLEAKEGKEAAARIVIEYKVEESVEVKDEPPVPDGSLFSERFTYSDEGLKYFKRQAKNLLDLGDDIDAASLGEILDALKESPPFTAVVTKTVTPANPTATPPTPEYTNVRVRAVPKA